MSVLFRGARFLSDHLIPKLALLVLQVCLFMVKNITLLVTMELLQIIMEKFTLKMCKVHWNFIVQINQVANYVTQSGVGGGLLIKRHWLMEYVVLNTF